MYTIRVDGVLGSLTLRVVPDSKVNVVNAFRMSFFETILNNYKFNENREKRKNLRKCNYYFPF